MFSHKNPTTQQFGPHRTQSRVISSIIENTQHKDHIAGIRFNDSAKANLNYYLFGYMKMQQISVMIKE